MEPITITIFGFVLGGPIIIAALVEWIKDLFHTTGWVNKIIALVIGGLLGLAVYWLLPLLVSIGVPIAGPVFASWFAALIVGIFTGGVAAGLWKTIKKLLYKEKK